VYSSLALINREHCKNIANADIANLTIIPYEPDTFNPALHPEYAPLLKNDIRYKKEVSKDISAMPYV